MIWEKSNRFDQRAREIADRHYNRQKPGTPQFVPPGRCYVLYAENDSGRAFWVKSYPFAEYVRHAWAGAWTPEEDELLLHRYQKERKTIAQLSEELNRTQDATRNRLYLIQGGGKPKGVTASVQLSAKEFDEMRAARTEVKNARKVVEQAKATEREISAFYALGKQLLNARQNKRAITPLFAELQKLVDTYENF